MTGKSEGTILPESFFLRRLSLNGFVCHETLNEYLRQTIQTHFKEERLKFDELLAQEEYDQFAVNLGMELKGHYHDAASLSPCILLD